jgi:hypothetical protein
LLLFLAVVNAMAQAKVDISPKGFTAEDRITITVDVAGTVLDGVEPLYIWAWVPGCCGADNGEWNNSNEANKMTKVRANVWSISFVPTAFYKKNAGEIGEIGFLVKAKDGSGDKKTQDMGSKVESLVYVPKKIRVFPSQFTQDDVITIIYDQKLDDNPSMKALREIYMYTDISYDAGADRNVFFQPVSYDGVGDSNYVKFKSEGNGIYTLTMIPAVYYGSAATPTSEGKKPSGKFQINSIKVHVRSKGNPYAGGAPQPPASLGDVFFNPEK